MPSLTPTRIPYLTHVWNPVTGCTPAGEGCRNCYAARLAATRLRDQPRYRGLAFRTEITGFNPDADPQTSESTEYTWTGEVRFHADLLDAPLRARKPRVIGVCFMGDLFHPGVTDEQIEQVLSATLRAPQHRYVVLTKRPGRMRDFFLTMSRLLLQREQDWERLHHGTKLTHVWPIPNLILGVSISTQREADRAIPILLDTPAACRVVSLEPMVEAVNVPPWLHGWNSSFLGGPRPGIDAIFLGGESGPGARPMRPEWALDVYRQCKAAGTPFYWKQFGDAFDYSYDHDRLGPDFDEMVLTRELPEAMQLAGEREDR